MTDEAVQALVLSPPCSELLGSTQLLDHDQERGWIRFGFEATTAFTNPAGRAQGGLLTAMLDEPWALRFS